MRTPLPFLLATLLLSAPAAAQDLFRTELDGSQEVPPVSTSAGGWARFVLRPDDTLEYEVRTWGVAGTAAHLHAGDPGANGSIVLALAGGPSLWTGTSAPLPAADIAALRAGGLYVNVHSAAYPSGEIRGQVHARPLRFAARLDGNQMVPPVPTAATGVGTFEVNPDGSITYDVQATGLTGQSCHIHLGDPGVGGSIVFLLQGGPTHWSGTTAPMDPVQFGILQAGGMNVIIHTAAWLFGEIRGQILPSGIPYGAPCPGPPGLAAGLAATGAPMSGTPITVRMSGGRAGGVGVLYGSLGPGAVLRHGCPLLISAAGLHRYPVALDAAGGASLPVVLPKLSSSLDVYLQFWGWDAAGWYTSNGLGIPIAVF